MDGGSTPADGAAAAKLFGQAGIDLLDISGGICGYIRPGLSKQGYFGELTAAVKATVGLPVILTGGNIHAAETLLGQGKADLIGVGRAMLKDSGWAKNAMESTNGQ